MSGPCESNSTLMKERLSDGPVVGFASAFAAISSIPSLTVSESPRQAAPAVPGPEGPTPDLLGVILAIGNRIVCDSVRLALEANGANVVAVTANASATILALQETHAKAILFDISRPINDLLGIMQQAKAVVPDVRFIMLADRPVPDSVSAFVHVMATNAGMSELAEVLGVKPSNLATTRISVRERQILELIAEGMSNPEIAVALNISHRTVANHVAKVFRKLGVRDRTRAVLTAARMGLIKLVL